MTTIESEMKRLEGLRTRYATVNSAIVQAKDVIVRGHRTISAARVAAVIDPETNTPKATETLCKRADSEMKAAEAEIQKLTIEAEALSGAIARIEGEIVPKRHAERLGIQGELSERYKAIARRMYEAANLLEALSAEAKSIFDGASSEFAKSETCEGQCPVLRSAGLAPIWDPAWIGFGQGTRRNNVVGAIYDFDPTLIDEADPVALAKRHQEQHRRNESERIERERQAMLQHTEPAKVPGEVRGKVLIPNPQNPNWFRKQI